MPISRLKSLYATVVLYEKSHLKWKRLAISELPIDIEEHNVNCMQGCRSYVFFWVRTHPPFRSWVRIGIGPTHFFR